MNSPVHTKAASAARGLATALALVIAALPSMLSAQSGALIIGHVTDESGAPLVGIDVRIQDSPRRATTDHTGAYRLVNLAPGAYTFAVEGLGYRAKSVAVTAAAGTRARIDVVLEPDPLILRGLLVQGQRRGQALAMQQQRSADNIRTVVSSEFIDRFPDANAAEALQRLPGLSVARDQGEGRYILVRGAQPRLNSVSIDGLRVPAPEGEGRVVALDVVPVEALAGVEVSKTLTPDMDGDAIGGAINLVTRGIPSRDITELSVAGGMNEQTSGRITNLSGTWARRLGGQGQHGLTFGGSYHTTDRGSEDLEMGWDGDPGAPLLDELQMRHYEVSRSRVGLFGSYGIDPGDGPVPFEVRALFTRYSDQEFRRRSRIRFGKGDLVSPNKVEDARIQRDLKDRLEEQRIWLVSASGTRLFASGALRYGLSVSGAGEDEPDRSDITFLQKKMGLQFDVADPALPTYGVTTGGEFDAAAYEFDEWVVENNKTSDRDVAAALDYSAPFSFGRASATFAAGVKGRLKNKRQAQRVEVYDGFDGDLSLAGLMSGPEPTHFFDGRYRVGPTPDPLDIRAFTRENRAGFALDESASREDSDPGTYSAEENVYAAYVMTTIDRGRIQLVPGIRVEVARSTSTANEVLFDEEGDYASTVGVSASASEVHWLPGINLRVRAGRRSNLRAAVTRSLARPNYFDLAPYRVLFRDGDEVALGNPVLRATTSTNLDLLFETYLQSIGVVSVGLFHKRIDGFAYLRRFDIEGGDLDGFEAIQPWNAGAGRLTGLELAWSQQLVWMPGSLDGLSVHTNYTLTDSETDILDRDEATPLPGQARHVGNVAMGYEKRGISARLSVNFHGTYVEDVGDDSSEDLFYQAHTQVDLSASYRLTPQAQLFLELINLTDEPLRYYQGNESRPVQREYYSRWGQLGVKVHAF